MPSRAAQHVLIVDDSEATRYLMRRTLERAAYDVSEAGTVRGALTRLETLPAVDLLILDVNLPDTDGYTFCHQLRADARFTHLPLLMTSAYHTGTNDVVTGLDVGADVYLPQPIEPPVLMAAVRSLLCAREAEGQVRALNLTLERRIEERTVEVETHARHVETLARLGDALQRAASPDEVSQEAVTQLAPVLRARAMLVIQLAGEELLIPHLWGDPPDYICSFFAPSVRPLRDATLLAHVANSGEAAYLNDYAAQPHVVPGDPPHLACAVERICQPDGTLDGFLVCWRDVGPWQDGERHLLRHAAGTIGLALERAHSARLLQEGALRLVELNAELSAYATSLSTDMKEPVRRIRNFTALLERRVNQANDEQTRRYFEIIGSEAQQVESFAEDLATLAQGQGRDLRLQDVPLSLLVTQVRSDLAPAFKGHKARWEVGDLPVVRADLLLRQALTNLLHIALKFTRERPDALIHVEGHADEHETIVAIRDNGLGFAPSDADSLFRVFTRLHEGYGGAGAGLANVRRIVARHGGRVWTQGRKGEGATFWLALPRHTVRAPAGS